MYNNNYICEIFDEIKFIDNQKKELIKIDNTYKSTYINTIINKEEIITNMAIETTNIRKWNISDIICRPYYFLNNVCLPTIHNSMIEMIRNDIVNGQIDQLLENVINENKIDIYKYDNNIKYQITSSFNQKNKAYENISIIDLKDCENQLKYIYNISLNDTLIIFKYDYILKEISTPIVGYEIFHPKTKKILDLNHCKDKIIDIITPVNIDENKLYKHDPNNNYYKDKCNPFPNEKGVDMTIYEKKKEYNDKNLALCGNKCVFIEYNNTTKKVICQCEPQFNSSLLTLDKIIKKEKLLHNFIDLYTTTNIYVFKCYKKFLSLNGLKKNVGSYILLSTILILFN